MLTEKKLLRIVLLGQFPAKVKTNNKKITKKKRYEFDDDDDEVNLMLQLLHLVCFESVHMTWRICEASKAVPGNRMTGADT